MSLADLQRHHYRPATENDGPPDSHEECATCEYFGNGYCSMFSVPVEHEWVCDEWEEATKEPVRKAANVDMHLQVVGVMTHPSGQRVYRLATRDGHYVGRTNPTVKRAVKGDVVKVTAAHIRQRADGDFDWLNTQVAAVRTGLLADSRRDLINRLRGETALTPDMALLGKDNATDVPPAGDQTNVTTNQVREAPMEEADDSDVHVNRPLRNLSIFYGKKPRKMRVMKATHQQLIYGVVLEPDVIDAQADYVPAAHVERAAHGYLKKSLRGKASVSKLGHMTAAFKRDLPSVVPVESFIAPVDFTYQGSREPVKKGSWVMVVHVEDPAVWQDFLDGKYGGFSVGGTGRRERVGGLYAPPPHPV